MFADCCVECGHLLSQKRNLCPFCGWSLQEEQCLDTLASDYRPGPVALDDIGVDRLSDGDTVQGIAL